MTLGSCCWSDRSSCLDPLEACDDANWQTRFDFTNDSGEALAGLLEHPEGEPHATAIFAHCFTCTKNVLSATHVSRSLTDHGIAVLRFDFTGLGHSEGEFANTTFTSNVEDIFSASQRLGEALEPPQLLIGHSLGGAAVLAAAGRLEGIRAVATIGALSEPSHVLHLLGDRVEELADRNRIAVTIAGRSFTIGRRFVEDVNTATLQADLERLDFPVLFLYSPQDQIVDVDHARRFYEAAKHPKSFVSLDGMDHLLTKPDDARYVADVVAAWSRRYLRSS